jgi:molybdenum cofactor synthesis domain-containing protein
LLEEWAAQAGHTVPLRGVVPDESIQITRTLLDWAARERVDAIFTTGGTGFGPRDVTPEATRPVLERLAPGLAERIRRFGEASTPFSVLSRGLAGERDGVLIVNLPGSPGGVRDGIAVVGPMLNHVTALLRGDAPDHTPPAEAAS